MILKFSLRVGDVLGLWDIYIHSRAARRTQTYKGKRLLLRRSRVPDPGNRCAAVAL
jgi:hypothetical protein